MRGLRSTQLIVGVALALGSGVVAACGGTDDRKSTSEEATGFDSAYCTTARGWAAHELNGDGEVQYQRGGPTAFRTYWKDYVDYTETSLQQAPPVIHEAAAIKARGIRRVTGLLEKYGFDPMRAEAEASASEKARAEPTPQERQAQDATHAYDDRVCLYGGSPPAAKVTFKRTAEAKPYCEAVAAQQEAFGQRVVSSKFDPEAFKAYTESDGFSKGLETQNATAPDEISADVKADNEWVRTHGAKVLEDYDYDLRRLLREGNQDELAAYTNWDPEIRDQNSRVTAYQQQVCGIEN
jgi:hypothetical protein